MHNVSATKQKVSRSRKAQAAQAWMADSRHIDGMFINLSALEPCCRGRGEAQAISAWSALWLQSLLLRMEGRCHASAKWYHML